MKPDIKPDIIRGDPKCSGKDCRKFHDTTTMNDECYEDLTYVEIGDTCIPGLRQQRDEAYDNYHAECLVRAKMQLDLGDALARIDDLRRELSSVLACGHETADDLRSDIRAIVLSEDACDQLVADIDAIRHPERTKP
jgi:hypothetical protein